MPPRIAGNIVTTQWLLPITGDAQTPALDFGARNGVSRGSANIINVHVGGTTPVTATATGLATTTTTVATRFVGDGSGLTNIIRTVAISSVQIVDSSNVLQDDTALDSATGGYIRVTGTGFGGGSVVTIGGVLAMSTTVLSSTQLFATVSPQTAGTYAVTVTRADGVYATKPLAVTFSPFPAWSTSGALGNVYGAFSKTIAASSDSGIMYANVSALPSGIAVSSDGVVSGDVSALTSDTTYTLNIDATDAEFQNTSRTFTMVGRPLFGGGAALYALRALGGYSGNVVQIRRSSDNALANIGCVANVLDTSSLLTFTGINGNAFVQTWYDQSGLGNHLTQATAAAQPGIVGMGQLVTENGKPALWFDGARYLGGGDVLDLQANSVTTFTTARFRNELSSIQTLWQKSYFAPGAGRYGVVFAGNAIGVQSIVDVNGSTSAYANVATAYTNVNTYGMRYTRGSNTDFRVNGGTSSITSNTVTMTGNITQPFRLGAYTNNDSPTNTASYFLQGTIQEHLHYFGAIDDERRNAVDADILSYSKPAAIVGTLATGGTVVVAGNVVTHTFTSNGTFICSTTGNVEYLIVGGGGGGGSGTGAGGGGGGVLVGVCSVIANTYPVIVGLGGAGDADGMGINPGSSGQSSSFNSLVAYGGGGGHSGALLGITGGCGGGSVGGPAYPAGSGIVGQGFGGGISTNWATYYGAGGGGGAGSPGVNGTASAGGNGGAGFRWPTNGQYYGGGGGGGTYLGGTLGLGGLGGGGNAPAGNATTNTGGGGGGQKDNLTAAGGNGGSGIVILRYSLVLQDVEGGIYTVSGGYAYYTFTNSDALVVRTAKTVDILVVAGGGAGGGGYGGGGGAGGVLLTSNVSLSANTYSIVVGFGGAGTTGGAGGNGQNSSFLSYVAIGGGGGGGNTFTGGNGGSGGGGGGYPGYSFAAGLGTAGQGTNGVTATSGVGGGGGGFGGTGSGLNGGPGAQVWGTYYGGGGGGFSGSVGIGGGGGGGYATNTPNGTAGTGGGGGAWNGTATTSGIGGSGIVIVRHLV